MATRSFSPDILRYIAGLHIFPHRFRPALLRFSGVSIGGQTLILSGLFAPSKPGGTLSIGDRCFINYNCYFDLQDNIVIGDDVQVADNVKFVTSTHKVGGPERRAGISFGLPISVGEGCWIGSSVTVLPGVHIGAGCVIAAGSVVTRDCAAHGLYAGAPAKFKRRL